MTTHPASTDLTTAGDATPLGLIAAELTLVERRIQELASSHEPKLTQIANELILSGGKRVRPALSLLVFRAAGGIDPTDTIDVGAALELIHTATLLHDDILDSGSTRRGKPSPLARHGIGMTLVTGDFLFTRAFGVAGRFEELVVGWATDACVALCEGEVMQRRFKRNPAATLDHYLRIAGNKTASLFSQAARIGAHFAGASTEVVEGMFRLGYELGLGFQMVDDLLDVLGPEELIGKPVGSDLREGAPALPTVLGLQLPAVRAAFTTETPSVAAVGSALDALRSSPVIGHVRRLAAERIRSASGQLALLGPSRFRSALADLAEDLLARTA
ncbi:MAG: polyprenyl synthetase family protein [Deltaproteobacteria bacterium]|nr:polyprenyl synthetase family protein [Deltaproteobacteria bacterium]